jgi:hypothetical protein
MGHNSHESQLYCSVYTTTLSHDAAEQAVKDYRKFFATDHQKKEDNGGEDALSALNNYRIDYYKHRTEPLCLTAKECVRVLGLNMTHIMLGRIVTQANPPWIYRVQKDHQKKYLFASLPASQTEPTATTSVSENE